MLTKEQQKEFEQLARPLIKWLCLNQNPHSTILIEPTGAELLGGEYAFQCDEFVLD